MNEQFLLTVGDDVKVFGPEKTVKSYYEAAEKSYQKSKRPSLKPAIWKMVQEPE